MSQFLLCLWVPPLLCPAFGAVWCCHSSLGSCVRMQSFLDNSLLWSYIGPHVDNKHLQWPGFQVQGDEIKHNTMKPMPLHLDWGKERKTGNTELQKEKCSHQDLQTSWGMRSYKGPGMLRRGQFVFTSFQFSVIEKNVHLPLKKILVMQMKKIKWSWGMWCSSPDTHTEIE